LKKALILSGFVSVGAWLVLPSYAQDLQAELDALDELPEDDLSGFSPSEDSSYIPDADSFGGSSKAASDASTKTKKKSTVSDTSSSGKQLGVSDLDLQGLEQELNFDSFKDGSKIGLDQLQQQQDPIVEDVTGRVTGIDFKQLSDRVRLVVRADRPIDWTRELRSKRRQVIVELRNMVFAKEILKRALDTGEFEGPVALVKAYPSKVGGRDSVKVLFQLRSFVDPTILRTGNDLVIDFPIMGGDTLFRSKSTAQVIVPKTYLSVGDLKEFKGAPITLNVKNAELADVLNLISKSAGKNFIVSGTAGSNKKITVNLNNVPWDQALALTLFNNGLGFQDLETVYRVAEIQELQRELDVAREAAMKTRALIPVETRLIPLSYAKGEEVSDNIKNFISRDRGSVTVDKRSNTLVVTDIPEVLEKIDRYVRSIDKQTPQILIEARIVEATEEFTRNRNFAWTLGSPLSDTTEGGSLNVGGSTNQQLLPNNALLRVRQANLGGINLVDAFLRMSEREFLSRTIASPRVTVLANEQATIAQGEKRQTTTQDQNNNTVVRFLDIFTELKVTPQVTSDGFVIMDLDLRRDIPSGDSIGSRSAKTKMIVESGKTAVIGGLFTLDNIEREEGTPFLRKIPIFGSLFQNDVFRSKSSSELLMFISPSIINADRSQVVGTSNMDEGDFSASKVEAR
jgi:type IV pilus assembly protein PilQ